MKKILLLWFCLAVKAGFAQITVDPGAERAFGAEAAKLPASFQDAVSSRKQMKQLPGVAIFTKYRIDTLNKSELKNQGAEVTLISPNGKPAIVTGNEKTGLPIPAAAQLSNDTLIMYAPFVPFDDQYVNFKIIQGKLRGWYCVSMKRDTILRLKAGDKKTNNLQVPIKIVEFKMSNNKFKTGQTVYAEVEYMTEPFFIDDANFQKGYLQQSLHCKYVFAPRCLIETQILFDQTNHKIVNWHDRASA